MKILLISGHGSNDPGACSNFGIEREEARKVTEKLSSILNSKSGINADIYPTERDCYTDIKNGNVQVNFKNYDYILEVHFNSASATAKGTEIFVTTDTTDTTKEANIIKSLESLGLVNRGVKKKNFTVINSAKNKGVKASLLEVCFISNSDDMQLYRRRFDEVCNNIANALVGGTVVNTPSVPSTPVVTDNWVSRLQSECNAQGFSNQKVDGIAGPNTLKGCPTIKKGARGNISKLLQEKLVSLGYNTNGVDGIFGSGTHNAVVSYQKSKGLSADGIVGQNTWRKLLNI